MTLASPERPSDTASYLRQRPTLTGTGGAEGLPEPALLVARQTG